jgi:hemoglobin
VAETTTLYDRVGGTVWFDGLTRRFYDGVAVDAILRRLYPEDLEPGREHLRDFLVQYWGGPTHYSDARGHAEMLSCFANTATHLINEP